MMCVAACLSCGSTSGDVREDLLALVWSLAKRIIGAPLKTVEQDIDRRGEKYDRVEPMIELALVGDRALNEQRCSRCRCNSSSIIGSRHNGSPSTFSIHGPSSVSTVV